MDTFSEMISSLVDLAWAKPTSREGPLRREDSASTVDEVCSAYDAETDEDAVSLSITKEDAVESRNEKCIDKGVEHESWRQLEHSTTVDELCRVHDAEAHKQEVGAEGQGETGVGKLVEEGDEGQQRRQLDARLQRRLEQLDTALIVAAWAKIFEYLTPCENVQHPTPFHSSRAPPISILDYFARISNYFQCSSACLIIGPVLIDRLVKMHPGFEINKLNIHRLLATSVMLAAKYHDDVFYSNGYYAKVAGMTVKELNYLEACFLRMIKWQLQVSPEEFEKYVIAVHPAVA